MQALKVIPTLRIFDYKKAIEFYIDWLGFTIVWEHTFDDNAPVYMEIEKGGVTLHLSEHHGDGTPGTHVFIWCTGLKEYHKELIDKKYKYNRPGLDEAFYGAWCMVVNDPFNNKISFNEKIETPKPLKGSLEGSITCRRKNRTYKGATQVKLNSCKAVGLKKSLNENRNFIQHLSFKIQHNQQSIESHKSWLKILE